MAETILHLTPRSCFPFKLGRQSLAVPSRARGPGPRALAAEVREIKACLVSVPELVMLLEWWSGTECVIYTDPRAYPKYGKENAIVVLNHKFEIDFLCGWSLAERFGVLGVSQTRTPLVRQHNWPFGAWSFRACSSINRLVKCS